MRKIYEIGKELGITEEEIKEILNKATNDGQKMNEPMDTYKGGRYGTVSIRDL